MKMNAWFAAVAAALSLTACGGGGSSGSGGGSTAMGRSAVFLKDAPIVTSDGRPADQVNVEILKVELESGDRDITVFEAAPGAGITLNVLALTFPTLLSLAEVPAGSYDEIEIKINPANATIHFTDDDSTVALVVTQEGDEEAEYEFEFEPAFTVEAGNVSNAVVDFAPLVSFDGSNYFLGHDHENDDTGEVEDVDGKDDDGDDGAGGDGGEDGPDHHGAEVEGSYVSISGDLITVSVYGSQAQIDISTATVFEVDDVATDKAGFVASLTAGEEIEGEGVFSDGVLVAAKIKNQGLDD